MINLDICCLVLIIGSVEVGPNIDMKFHQEVMEIVSYDILLGQMESCPHDIQAQPHSSCPTLATNVVTLSHGIWTHEMRWGVQDKTTSKSHNTNISCIPMHISINVQWCMTLSAEETSLPQQRSHITMY